MARLVPKFTMRAVAQHMQNAIDDANKKVIEAYQFEGEQFVTRARNSKIYQDRTSNLKSSIGYIILQDGEIIDSDFEGKAKGQSQAKKVASEVSENFKEGIVLIVVAGMNYAAHVENKGYQVLTGFEPSNKDLKDLLDAIKL